MIFILRLVRYLESSFWTLTWLIIIPYLVAIYGGLDPEGVYFNNLVKQNKVLIIEFFEFLLHLDHSIFVD